MIILGEKIKELRQRDGRTQEMLASEMGVTAQAVSRWEKGICYPDMEFIPSIANYFGVSIDELFGYENERSKKIEELFNRIIEMNSENNGVDVSMDECVRIARGALIEFPANYKLTFALASVLFNAGYVKKGEHHIKGDDGFLVYDTAKHSEYSEWQEAIKLYEKLLPELPDGDLKEQAVLNLSQLYKNIGEADKAMKLAKAAPEIRASKPFLRINAFDGKEAVEASREALVETVRCSAELISEIVRNDCTMMPEKASEHLSNAIAMLGFVFSDGDFGRLNGFVSCLHMLRSYYLWIDSEKDEAFAALDFACFYAKLTDASFASELHELWPWWDVPDRDKVRSEMQSDHRWTEWMSTL